METKLLTIAKEIKSNDPSSALEEAGEILRGGGLVAFPTETVYGLGGDALDPEAAKRIYDAKGRPSDNPLIVHIADEKDLNRLASSVPEKAKILADLFWPGPLTMIFPKKKEVPDATTGGLATVAVRMPSHPVAYELIRRSGVLIAAPSANLSGRPSPTRAEHVAEDMTGRIPMILDGGPCDLGIESTIVDLTSEVPMILRPGYITEAMLREAVGEIAIDPTILGLESKTPPKAPGMRYTHYAPKGEMTIIEGSAESVAEAMAIKVRAAKDAGKRVGVLVSKEQTACERADVVRVLGSREDPLMISANLYHMLREFDSLGAEVIYTESFAGEGLGTAIMNRLIRAAGHRVLSAEDIINQR